MANLSDIAVCEDGCLLISIQNQLVKMTLDGLVLASIGKRGERGRRDNELDKPNGVAIGREGQIYVADQANHRIQIFHADLTYKGACSFPNCAATGIQRTDIYPEKIAINSAGNIYVTNSMNTCAYVFNVSGQFLFSFGKRGSSRDRGSLSSPTAIAIDSDDYVYISESNFGVSIFDKEGCFVKACGNNLKDVKAMHIDSRGNLCTYQ